MRALGRPAIAAGAVTAPGGTLPPVPAAAQRASRHRLV